MRGSVVQIEAVENHMPEVIVVDEIGTEAEALACRTIAERGVTLVATAHGQFLENLMNNPMLSDLIGGLESVTLGDDTARSRNSQKSVLERRAPSTFPVLVEMRERDLWVQHDVEESVDALLLGDMPYVKVRALLLSHHIAGMMYCRVDAILCECDGELLAMPVAHQRKQCQRGICRGMCARSTQLRRPESSFREYCVHQGLCIMEWLAV